MGYELPEADPKRFFIKDVKVGDKFSLIRAPKTVLTKQKPNKRGDAFYRDSNGKKISVKIHETQEIKPIF